MIGFFNVLKPTGVSSGYVVSKLKHILNEKRVGHLGTLDPLASGVLPVAVGKATRFFDYFLNKDKVYFALMKVGVLTDTLDSEGKVMKRDLVSVSLENLKRVASELEKETSQIPPNFSAKMVNGKRAYALAKEGKEFSLAPKKVQIYSINVEKWHQNGVFALKIHCSAGTYVRSIVRDLAEKLNTVATTVAIIRQRSGPFTLENSFTLNEIEEDNEKCLIRVQDVLGIERIDLSKSDAKTLQEGKTIKRNIKSGDYLAFYNESEFGVLSCENGELKIKIYLFEGENL